MRLKVNRLERKSPEIIDLYLTCLKAFSAGVLFQGL